MSGARVFDIWDSGERPKRGDLPPPPPSGPPEQADPWPTCPFTPLGAGAGRYWFLDAQGALTDVPSSTLAQWPKLLELCAGDRAWLVTNFPAFDKEGLPIDWFNLRSATGAIMRRCAEMPPFDAEMARRRYGLWKVADGYALHLGDRIEWCGGEERAGFVRENVLWLRLSPRGGHAAPADVSLGAELEKLLATWSWRDKKGAGIMLGLMVSGWIAGALPWRPHGFVVGEGGSGKTTLLRDVIGGLCPLTRYLNDYTEPGIRQLLSESATCIVLDEAEGDSGTEMRLRRTIEMLRRASSGSGVQSVKGSSDHTAKQFTLTGSAIMGAILPPPLEPQDASRFTVLELDRLVPTLSESDITAFVARNGPALWGRAIAEISRILALVKILRQRIIDRGFPARIADQLATIAACRWVMLRDAGDDPRSADVEDGPDEALAIVDHLFTTDDERVADSTGNQALGRLLMSAVDMAGDKKTLGQVLNRHRWVTKFLITSAGDREQDEERKVRTAEGEKLDALLQGHGVRWGGCEAARADGAPAPPLGLFVCVAAHPRLERAFADTAWTGKRWGAALAQLPGALGGRALPPQRIGGHKPRVVWVPAVLFEAPEDD